MNTEDTIFIDTKQLAERWRMDARSIHNLRLKTKGLLIYNQVGLTEKFCMT